jgi:ArsR family transcriptional regulator
MSVTLPPDLAAFAAQASEVAGLLKAMANQRRLMVLCKLVEVGEMRVGELVEAVGLSQSALSQHLAVMREEGLVTFRRESQALWYRIADPRTEALLAALHHIFCPKET